MKFGTVIFPYETAAEKAKGTRVCVDPPVTIGLKRYKVDKHIYLPSLVFSWMMVVKVFKKINCFDRLDWYNVLNLDIAVNWNTLEYPPYNRLNLQEVMKGMKNLEELNFNLDKEMCCSNYQVSKVLDFCPIFQIIQPYCQKVKKIKMKIKWKLAETLLVVRAGVLQV